ncbi:MAG: DNA-3-methyladenine glycosylase I [Legionellales bacterium]|nr:DNA-3-methyladenine glycosylase I [Legionellales bacterium]
MRTPVAKQRCFGDRSSGQVYADYHDAEWGCVSRCDRSLFEALVLEIAQAGLNFEMVLLKRPYYRTVYRDFDIAYAANMTDEALQSLMGNRQIIKHKKKLLACRTNANVILDLQKTYGSFYDFIWQQFEYKPIVNHWTTWSDVPSFTEDSQALCARLKCCGMVFIGPTIIYSFMQAVGIVDDHIESCWLRQRH